MRQNRLLIVLYTYITVCLSFTSCTYDYSEDETNYIVFVPEIVDKTISDCRVMVYNDAGVLVKARYASSPWDKDPRIAMGQFSFRLPPGAYKVYCYTNTDSLSFVDSPSLEQSAFTLKESAFGVSAYAQPPDLFFQKFTPSIAHSGYLYVDTLHAQRYTGRITVRFKNFPGNVSEITNVQLLAEGVSTKQHLKDDTLATRLSTSDVMYHSDKIPSQSDPRILEVDHRYFPSIQDEHIRLNFTFMNAGGGIVSSMPVEVTDKQTGAPLRLLHGQRIIIEIDSYTIVKISIVGWNEDIQSGNTDLE